MRTEATYIYSAQELREAHPDGYTRAREWWTRKVYDDPAWAEEHRQSWRHAEDAVKDMPTFDGPTLAQSQAYTVELYNGREHPAVHPVRAAHAATEREARRIAARMLGHSSLRGASHWDRYQGGTVYRFGPRVEDSEYDYAVIIQQNE